MTVVHTEYSVLGLTVIEDWDDKGITMEKMVKISEDMKRMKGLIKNTFESYFETVLFLLKFHRPNHKG